jgi:PRC-barrel domain
MTEHSDQPVELEHLQGDQEVYGSEGKRIGLVAALRVDIDTGEQYLEVSAGPFRDLFIPRRAIAYAVLGKPVLLKVTHDEALQRFTHKPHMI